jgi:GNAT superfamily N-acetyltransferase
MSSIAIEISENPTAEERDLIFQHLVDFNESKAGPAEGRELAIFARRNGEIVGAAMGATHFRWLFVRFLWVAETERGSRLGSRLLNAAEQEARARRCEHAHLDTFSFQALPFYQKHGYTIFGQLEDYPVGHTRYFLQKRNLSAGSVSDSKCQK